MKVLIDREGDAGRRDLEEAWSDAETFAYLPGKSGQREAWAAEALGRLPQNLTEGHFALLSSGSTGEPKLVVGSRERSLALARLLHEAQASEPARTAVGLLPLTYSYAFVNQFLWTRAMGREFVPTSGFVQPDTLGETLGRAPASLVCLVAAHVPLFARHLAGHAFPNVVRVHFAGGRFPQADLPAVRAFFPSADVYNNYGCIEAMPRLTLRKAEDADSASDIGRPLDGVALSADEEGRLLFRSPYGAVGWVDGSGFHAIGSEDWVPTGDLAHADAAGRWHLDGRIGEVFKRYGERISLPQLLDTVRGAWPGDAAFYRVDDSLGEAGHVLVVAPHPEAGQLRAVLARLRRDHPRAHWPLRVESVEAMPLLPNGKPDVGALPQIRAKLVQWDQRL
jgi:acyl-CoA synthetase (AMP-forming)/AMP-acid ligase II